MVTRIRDLRTLNSNLKNKCDISPYLYNNSIVSSHSIASWDSCSWSYTWWHWQILPLCLCCFWGYIIRSQALPSCCPASCWFGQSHYQVVPFSGAARRWCWESPIILYIGVDGPIPVTKIPFTMLACSSSNLVTKDSWYILYCPWLFLDTFFQCLLEFFLGTRFSYYPIKYTEMKSTTAFSFSFFKYILTDCISH